MPKIVPFGSWSLAAAGATVGLAQTFHPILLASVAAVETGAWLAMLLAGLMAAGAFCLVALPLRRLPGGNLIDLARAAGGHPAAVATGILVYGLLAYHGGLVTRQTAEMAVSAVYPHTPQTFAMAGLVLAALLGAYGSLPGQVRLFRLALPGLVLAILLILVATAGWGDIRFLLPIWGPGPAPLLAGSAVLSALHSPVALFLLMAAGQLRDRHLLWRAGTVAIGVSSALLAAVKVMLLMTFPLPLGFSITFPLHSLARLVIGGRFFERLEAVWVVVWFFATACHLAGTLHAGAAAYAQAFGMSAYRKALLALFLMVVTIGLFPPDQGQAIAWHMAAAPAGLAVGFGLPLALTAGAAWRGRFKQREN